jgi:hypothetical protein
VVPAPQTVSLVQPAAVLAATPPAVEIAAPTNTEGPDVKNLASWDACRRLFLAIDADFVQLKRWESLPQTLDTLDAPNPVHAVATDLNNLKEQMKFLLRKYSDPSIR